MVGSHWWLILVVVALGIALWVLRLEIRQLHRQQTFLLERWGDAIRMLSALITRFSSNEDDDDEQNRSVS